jgi:hypothetical protein
MKIEGPMKSERSDKIDDIATETLALANEMAQQLAANDNLQAELDKVQAEFSVYWQQETDGAVSRWRT